MRPDLRTPAHPADVARPRSVGRRRHERVEGRPSTRRPARRSTTKPRSPPSRRSAASARTAPSTARQRSRPPIPTSGARSTSASTSSLLRVRPCSRPSMRSSLRSDATSSRRVSVASSCSSTAPTTTFPSGPCSVTSRQPARNIFTSANESPAGEVIARLGRPDENGEWPPHLHFQVMTDLCELARREIIGVVAAQPVGRVVERLPRPEPRTRPSRRVQRDGGPRSPTGFVANVATARPFAQHRLRRAAQDRRRRGRHLIDEDGTRWLDMVNNVCHVGHCHPRVVKAAQPQMAQAQHQFALPARQAGRISRRRLTDTFPDPLERAASSSTPAARPTTSRCGWRAPTPATATSSPSITPITATYRADRRQPVQVRRQGREGRPRPCAGGGDAGPLSRPLPLWRRRCRP